MDTRRGTLTRVWRSLGACALALLLASAAHAYPDKPLHLIVPFPAGGGADSLARLVMPKVAQALGQPIVIENKAGAGGNIGAEVWRRQPLTATPCCTARTARTPSTPACTRSCASIRPGISCRCRA